MANHCFIPLLGKRIRVTELDNCGRPLPTGTEDAVVATDGFVSVSLSAETEDGAEIITKKANGDLCVNEKMADSFKRFTAEIKMCGVNPALMTKVTNANAYEDAAGDIAGFTVREGKIERYFALELWTGLSGLACEEGDEEASGYFLLPFVVAGTMDDLEVGGEDAIDFTMTGGYTKGDNNWGAGPFAVVYDADGAKSVLTTPLDPKDHLLIVDTGVAPPPSACDPVEMPEPPAAGGGGTGE